MSQNASRNEINYKISPGALLHPAPKTVETPSNSLFEIRFLLLQFSSSINDHFLHFTSPPPSIPSLPDSLLNFRAYLHFTVWASQYLGIIASGTNDQSSKSLLHPFLKYFTNTTNERCYGHICKPSFKQPTRVKNLPRGHNDGENSFLPRVACSSALLCVTLLQRVEGLKNLNAKIDSYLNIAPYDNTIHS